MSKAPAQVELICVGNELLIGKTLNTNAQWLAKRITSLGLSVRRITVVGDDLDESFCLLIVEFTIFNALLDELKGLG